MVVGKLDPTHLVRTMYNCIVTRAEAVPAADLVSVAVSKLDSREVGNSLVPRRQLWIEHLMKKVTLCQIESLGESESS